MTKEDVIKEYRVREILEAARKTIGRFGIQGATIDRVAEEAKVAKGTIYLYFPSKEELVHAAVLEGIRSMNAETLRVDDPARPALERVRTLIRSYFKIQQSNQDFLKTFIIGNQLDIELESPRGRQFIAEYRSMLDYLAGVLREAIAQGSIRKIDPDFVSYMLAEMIFATLRRRVLGLTTSEIEADADNVTDFVLRGIQAAPCV